MSKPRKFLLIFLIGMIIIIIGGGIYLFYLISDEESLKQEFLSKITTYIDATVKIGHIKLSLSEKTLELEGLELEDRKNETLASFKKTRISFQGNPFFSNMSLSKLEVFEPVFSLRHYSDGLWNFGSDIIKTNDAGDNTLIDISINNGKFILEDHEFGKYIINGINISLNSKDGSIKGDINQGFMEGTSINGIITKQKISISVHGVIDSQKFLKLNSHSSLPEWIIPQGSIGFNGQVNYSTTESIPSLSLDIEILPHVFFISLPSFNESIVWNRGKIILSYNKLNNNDKKLKIRFEDFRIKTANTEFEVKGEIQDSSISKISVSTPSIRIKNLCRFINFPPDTIDGELKDINVGVEIPETKFPIAYKFSFLLHTFSIEQRVLYFLGTFKCRGEISLKGNVFSHKGCIETHEANLKWNDIDIQHIVALIEINERRCSSIYFSGETGKIKILARGKGDAVDGLNLTIDPIRIDQENRDLLCSFIDESLRNSLKHISVQGDVGPVYIYIPYQNTKDSGWDARVGLSKFTLGYQNRPITLKDVTGEVKITPNGVYWDRLDTKINESSLLLGKGGIKLEDKLIENTKVYLKPFYIDRKIWEAIPEGREVWRTFQPIGWVEGEIDIQGPLKDPQLKAQVHCWDMNAVFEEIPYPVKIDNAFLDITRQDVTLKSIFCTNQSSGARFSVQGKVWPFVIPVGYSVTVKAKGVKPDKEVYSALFKDVQEIWDEISPQGGSLDMDLWAKHRPGVKEKVLFNVDISANKVNALYRGFPYQVYSTCGKVTVSTGKTYIHHLDTEHGQGKLTVEGELRYGEGDKKICLYINGESISLDQQLKNSLPEYYHSIWEEFAPKGKIDVQTQLIRSSEGGEINWKSQVEFRNISAKYKKFPYPVENLHGKLIITPSYFQIDNIEGNQREAQIQMSGRIDQEKSIDIIVMAHKIPIDDTLKKALPSEYNKIWDILQLEGDIASEVRIFSTSPNKPLELDVKVLPSGCCVIYRKFPYPLSNTKGVIKIKGEAIHLENLTAINGNTRFSINGRIASIQEGGRVATDLTILAENLEIDQNFRNALMLESPWIVKNIRPEGRIRAIRILLSPKQGIDQKFMSSEIYAQGISLNFAEKFMIKHFKGDITLSGYFYGSNRCLNGNISEGDLKIKGIPINSFSSSIRFVDEYLILDSIEGEVCQGKLRGSFIFETKNNSTFKGKLFLNSSEIQEIAKILSASQEKSDNDKELSGKLSGEVELIGNFDKLDEITGNGHLQIKDGSLWDLPLFAALCELLQIPVKATFQEGKVCFTLGNSKVNITSLEFSSPILSIYGKGNLDFDGNLYLILNLKFLPSVIDIPVLATIWGKVKSNIFSIEVKGNFNKPDIALKNIKDIGNFIMNNIPWLGPEKR